MLAVPILALAAMGNAGAQAPRYPARPITLVVGYGAGSGADIPARLLSKLLAEDLKQSVVVDNKPGAAGSIATARVAGAAPDGYTLLLLTASDTILAALRPNLSYDLTRDFTPISLVASSPFVLVVGTGSRLADVKAVVAAAQARAGQMSIASAGIGGASHLVGELFGSRAGVKFLHVPYKSGTESATATVTGEVDVSFVSVASALPLLQAGKLRALAVTSMKRSALLPAVPTLDESGLKGFEQSVWYGVLGPAGIPRPLVAQLNQAIHKAVNGGEVRETLKNQGIEPSVGTPEEFGQTIRDDLERNAMLVKRANIQPQ